MLNNSFQLLGSPDVSAVFNKEAGVTHSQHCKEHPQAEVVHEAQVLLDVAARRVADVKPEREKAVQEREAFRPALRVRDVGHVRVAGQIEANVSSGHV